MSLSDCFTPLVANAKPVAPQTTLEPSVAAIDLSFPMQFRRGWANSKSIIGSGYVEQGGSKVFAYLHSLRASNSKVAQFDAGNLACNITFASHLDERSINDFEKAESGSYKLEDSLSSRVVDALSSAIFLKHYPKTSLSITVLIAQSSAYDFAAIINCCTIALVDGAIDMKDMVTASYLSVQNEGKPIKCTLACRTELEEISHLDFTGACTIEQQLAIITATQQQCRFVRSELSKFFKSV